MDMPKPLSEEELDRRLISGEDEAQLREDFGDALYEELQSLARMVESGQGQSRKRGQVYLLPGIMGSKLSVAEENDTDLIWLNPFALRAGRVAELEWPSVRHRVFASGVFHFAYQRMRLRLLLKGHSVKILPYDWRSGIVGIAETLWPVIEGTPGPVSLICHSMGGLVGRALAGRDADRKIERVITLGTPNHGSYAPVTVLRGHHQNVQMLGKIDRKRTGRELVETYLNRFPGLLEMLPSPVRRVDEAYFAADHWPEGSLLPDAAILTAAGEAQMALAPPDDRFTQIVGVGHETIQRAHPVADTLIYHRSNDGDGTVPRDLAEMDGAKDRYYVKAKHGAMCNMLPLIRACDAVLDGERPDLTAAPERVRGPDPTPTEVTEKELQSEARRGLPRSGDPEKSDIPPQLLLEGFLSDEADTGGAALDDLAAPKAPPASEPAGKRPKAEPTTYVYTRQKQALRRINIDVMNENILDVAADAYVLGVFEGVTTLDGATGAVDNELDGMISALIGDGQITGRKGEVNFIPVPCHHLKTSHVVIVGLGVFGDERVIRDAVQVAGRNLIRALCISNVSSFAGVLLGARSGPSPKQIFTALFEGMFEALTDWDMDQDFNRIRICELNDDRFAQIRDGLNMTFAGFNMPDCEIVVQEKSVTRRRSHEKPDTRMPDIFTVRADLAEEDSGDPLVTLYLHHVAGSGNSQAGLPNSERKFRLSELDALMRPLEASMPPGELAAHAEEVEKLVLSPFFRDKMRFDHESDCGLQIICDQWASRVPWELLHLNGGPIALGGGISRWYLPARAGVRRATRRHMAGRGTRMRDLRMLLVADPTEDLSGAVRERNRIVQTVAPLPGMEMDELFQDRATYGAVSRALSQSESERAYDVFHYAGHAFFDPNDRARSGLILHADQTLRGTDIADMAQVPGFVFLNACESVRVRRRDDDRARPDPRDFTGRSTGLAEAFLLAGVRHIVGTFWPVPDQAAMDFAATFYARAPEMEIGRALIHARRELHKDSADWVNYIHYGPAADRI